MESRVPFTGDAFLVGSTWGYGTTISVTQQFDLPYLYQRHPSYYLESQCLGAIVDIFYLDSIMSNMTAISYTAARENLASTMDKVCADHAPIIITRNRDQSVVMLSLEDYEALEETAYLTRSPANARRLLDAIEQLESGHGVKKALNLRS